MAARVRTWQSPTCRGAVGRRGDGALDRAGRTRALLLPGDLRDESHCRAIVARTVAELGRLDIMVNNAAAQTVNESLDDVTAADLEARSAPTSSRVLSLPSCGAAHAARLRHREFDEPAGQDRRRHDADIYARHKGAIASFTIGLSNRLAPKGHSGEMRRAGTDLDADPAEIVKTPEQIEKLGADTPLGGPGSQRSSRRPRTCCSPRVRQLHVGSARSSHRRHADAVTDARHLAGKLSPLARE